MKRAAKQHSVEKTLVENDVWTLFDTSIVAQTTLDAYLQIILDRCANWFQAAGASIFLQEESSERYVLAAKSGQESSAPDDATIISGEGIAGSCIVAREPILIEDPSAHPALRDVRARKNKKWGSSLIVPLLTPDLGCIGVLNLSRTTDEPRFQNQELLSARSLGGHIALAVANGRLLSKLRKTVAEATQLHAKLDTILSAVAVGIVVLDPKSDLAHVNPEAAKMSKVALGESSDFTAFVDAMEPWLGEPLRRVGALASAGERTSAIARSATNDLVYTLTGSPLPGGGATIAIQDTSEHERAAKEIARVRRLAEIGQMTAAIAHEIRNPLWAMRAAAQVIQTDKAVAAEFGKIIEDETIKLANLCNDFLEFARPLELNRREARLDEFVIRIAEQHRSQFEAAGVNLEVVVESPIDTAWVDVDRFEQVIRNLALNALDASERGQTVRLVVSGSKIVVQDSGVGMEQSALERLFTPFFTTKPAGTGLGLSNVQKIVDAHGGAISVESSLGEGATFTVDLRGLAA